MGPSLGKFVHSLLKGSLQLVYPGLCWVCGVLLPIDRESLCVACQTALTGDDSLTCPRCSSTVGPFVNIENGCPSCRDVSFVFERVIRLGPYDGLLREVVLHLKHQTGEGLAEIIGNLWVEHASHKFAELNAEVVAPVPLHWWRRWQRGYNQAETLARVVAARLRLPFLPRCLRRVRNTPKQSLQSSPTVKQANVKGAFSPRSRFSLSGKRVLLIDDVLTTGATANEAARALHRAGAGSIVVAVLAHGHGR